MHNSALRHLLTFTLTATLLSPLYACGEEKRAKECAAKCDHEAEECAHRHEKDCVERTRHCVEECKK